MLRRYRRIWSGNFVEYFLYFLLLSLLVIFLLGGTMYYYSASILRRDAIASNNNTLTMLKNAQEVVFAQVDKSMETIILDPQYQDYMYLVYKQDLTTQIHLRMKLDDVVNVNDYIHSVYLYYYKDDYVLSTNQGPVYLQDFKDADFTGELRRTIPEKKLVRTRTINYDNSLQDQQVISVVRPLPLFFTGKPSAYLIINIKAAYLQQVIDSIKTNEDSSVMVADGAGNIISRKSDTGHEDREIVRQLIAQDNGQVADHRVIKSGQGDILVSYLKSDKYDWMYIYATPLSMVTQSISLWSKVSLLLCLSVLFFSQLGSLFLSNRIFVPVKRIMDTNKDLTLMLQDYEIHTRNSLFTALLKGTEEVDDKLMDRISYYGINCDYDGYFLICIVVLDDFAKFMNANTEQQRNTFVHHITESISAAAFAQREVKGFIVESNTNELALVLNFKAMQEAEAVKARGYGLVNLIHEMLAKDEPYTFTIGVSTLCKGISEVSKAYYEALSALHFKLMQGNNHVLFSEHLVKTEKHVLYPLSIEKKLFSSLNLGDREAIHTHLKEFGTYIYNNIPDASETVRLFFLQLFTSTLKNLHEMDVYPSLVSEIGHISYTDLLQQETIEGLIDYMMELYEQILSCMEVKKGQVHQKQMEAICEYIRQNLSTDLKLERIAEQFYFSSSYLRKLFKEEYGVTLKGFILNERIGLAKRLLEDPSIRIIDVAERVGYMSVTSFSKTFKIETGTSPGEYRTHLLFTKERNEPLDPQ